MFEAVEFGLQMHGTAWFVVGEEVPDLVPRREGRGVRFHHHIHQVVTEGSMDPHENREVLLGPGWIVGEGIVDVDMVAQIEPAEDDVEEVAPATVAVRLHVEGDRHQTFDVDAVCRASRGRRGSSRGVGGRVEEGHGVGVGEDGP